MNGKKTKKKMPSKHAIVHRRHSVVIMYKGLASMRQSSSSSSSLINGLSSNGGHLVRLHLMVGKHAGNVPPAVDGANSPVRVLVERLRAVQLQIGRARAGECDWVLRILIITVPALVHTQLVRGPAKVEVGPGIVASVLNCAVEEVSELVAGRRAVRRGLVGWVVKVKGGVTP